MEPVHLTAVTRTQGNNRAVKDGTVTPRGFALDFHDVPVLVQAFRRMVRDREFDVCEMAFTTYLCAKAHGKRITALPVFLVRGFHHGAIVRGAHGGVADPGELEGRRVGVNRGYTVTTGVWARGILRDEYGVDLSRVTWVRSGDEHVAEYRPPANVESMPPGSSLETMLASGDLAAAVGIEASSPGLVPLIPDPEKAALAALRDRGLYPINHLVVVKDELLEAYPDLAPALFDAFAAAKQQYVNGLGGLADPTPTDRMYQQVMRITGADPLPYGIAANRPMIDKLIEYAVQQRILERPPAVPDLFPASVHDLSA